MYNLKAPFLYAGAVLVWLVGVSAPAHAAITAKDLQVAGRVIGFVNPTPSGTLKLGIVYDPANATSMADKQALMTILGNGLAVAGITLVPDPVSIAALSGTDANILFLTNGLGAEAADVGKIAAAKKLLCITTDLSDTQDGSCAVAVQSSPNVQITVNKATLAASGISFTSAFMLMVTEI